MTMAITSFVVSALSVAYSYYQAEQMKSKAERARREAEENADLRKGLQTVVDCKAAPLAIYYGKNKAGGARVYHAVSNNYTYAPEPNAQVFESKKPASGGIACWELKNSAADWSGTWSLNPSNDNAFREIANAWITTKEDPSQWKRPNRKWEWGGSVKNGVPKVNYVFLRGNENQVPTKQLSEMGFNFPEVPGVNFVMDKNINGEKREFLFFQQALSHGGISDIVAIDVDSRPLSYESYQNGARIHAFKHGGVSDALMTANRFERNTAKFPKIAYLSCYFRLNRDDPQYSGVPTVQSYLFGNQVASVIKGGFLFSPAAPYSLGSPEYSNNAALVLLDYLLSKDYGRGLKLSEIDLASFYRASKVCGIVIKKVPVMGKIYQNQTGTRDLILYDFNSGVDSNQPMRGNIQKILDSMPYSALVWSDGKYKLNLPYAFLWSATQVFHPDDIVYVVDGHPKLFRAVETNINKNPLSSVVWVEDVLPQKFKNLSDEDLVNSNDIAVTWPDSNSKLNFVTVRFLNEAKDFEEDTASWPDKEPRDGSNVYATYLAEDKNRKLESEVSAEHICDMYHALAYAEQQVRRSRDSLSISAKFTAIAFGLEPGDLFGFSSEILNIPYAIYRVESTENSDGGVIAINAVTFDANLLAWNVDDNKVSAVVNVFQSNNLKQARNLSITAAVLANKSSGYRLSWEKSGDASVNTYLVKYATESFENIDENTNWAEVGEFSNTFCDLPPLSGTFVFTVVSKGANGKTAPFHSLAGGSEWPMLQVDLTADHLAGNSAITMVLSNEAHVIPADTNGTVLNGGYYGSGTDVQIVQGSEQLTYDPNIVAAGYYKVTVTASGITEGTLSVHNFNARLGESASMTADNATVTILAEGQTIDGTEFSLIKTQSVTKMRSGNSGDDAVLISLLTNANVIYKASSSAPNSGTYTSIAVSGKRTVGGVTAQYGVVTVKPDNGVESAKSANITYTPASTSGVSGVTLKLYDAVDSSTVLDTQYIPVVFKGDTGSSPINASVSNPTVAIQCNATGTPTGYSNTSTAIYLYQGDVALAYDGVGTANGTWKVVAVGTSITPSVVVTDMGDYVNFGSHAGITADSASILYTITGKSTNGTALALTVKQTFTKILRGETVIGDGSITAAKLATGAIDSTKFASSIEPITIVNTQTLPTTKSTTQISWNGAIYEWNGTAYTNTVPTANLSGTITASQIAEGSIGLTKFASGIEPIKIVSSLPVTKSTNSISYNGELYTWNGSVYSKAVKATDVTGQLTDAQIAALDATKVAGQLTDAQLANISASKMIGEVVATQIANGAISTAKFASGIEPVTLVAGTTVPTTKSTTVVMVNGKLYRWNGTAYTAQVPAADLTGQIVNTQIADDAITTPKLAANSVVAGKLAANSVVAGNIAADAITAGTIAAGAISAREISANAITTDKMVVGNTSNLIPNSDFATGDAKNWRLYNGAEKISVIQLAGAPTKYVCRFASGASSVAMFTHVNSQDMPGADKDGIVVNAGEQYSVSIGAYKNSTLTTGARIRVMAYFYKTDGNYNTSVTSITLTSLVTTAWATYTGSFTVPAGAVRCWLYVAMDLSPTAGDFYWTNLTCRQLIGDALIVDGGIRARHIGANEVTANAIASNAVTADEIAANAITAVKISAGAITAGKLAVDSVLASNIATGAVTADAILVNAVTATKIAANAVTATHIAADSITSAKIAAGAVNTDELAAGAITASKIAISDVTNLYPDMDMIDSSFYTSAGTVTFNGTTATPLGQNFLRLGGVATVWSGWFPVDPSADFYVTALAWLSAVAAGSSAVVGVDFGTLAANGTVTQSRSITLGTNAEAWNPTSSKFVGDVTTTSSERRMRFWVQNIGSASDACAGGFRVQRKANGSLIVDGAVIASKIAAGAITADKIAAGAITADKIAASSITSAQIAANSITSAQIAAGAINAQQIAAGAIGAEKLSIGSSQNLLPNPLFLNDFAGWTKSLGAFVRYVYPDGKVGVEVSGVACELRCDNFTTVPLIKVSAGDKLLCKITVEAATGDITVLTGLLGRVFYANGTTGAASILRIATLSQGLMQELSVEYTVPANVIGMSFYLNKGDAGNIVRFSDPVVARKTTGELLVDGSITASKIAADAVTANKINVTNLAAISGNMGTLTSGEISLNAVGSDGAHSYIRSNDKWWYDDKDGFVLIRRNDNKVFCEFKAGNSKLQISNDGGLQLTSPGLSLTNGHLTINELDVIGSSNIRDDAVTKAVSFFSGAYTTDVTFMSASISLGIQSKVIIFSSAKVAGDGTKEIYINGSLVRRISQSLSFSNIFFTNLMAGTHTVAFRQYGAINAISERSLLILAVAK